MDNDLRVSCLQSLGYSTSEASFLCLAALHSGFFLRRQYTAFSGKGPGYADMALVEKALKFGHARAMTMRHNRMLYHLCSKPFYAALGEADNRNRREREPQAIKRRLMMLDFALLNGAFHFFPTESEKLKFFGEELGIGEENLPRKLYRCANGGASTLRYFVDKSPLYIDPTTDRKQAPVHFCYIDEGLHSTSAFEQHLIEYRSLFARLGRVEMVYVACSTHNFAAAKQLFERSIGSTNRVPMDPLVPRLIEYFKVRSAYERRDMSGINQAKLIQLRADRAEFSDEKYERLFAHWQREGDRSIVAVLCPESIVKPTHPAQFRTQLLPFQYEVFGTLSKGEATHETRK